MFTQREFAMWHQESAWGTPGLTDGAPTDGAHLYFRLEENTFRINAMPRKIPYAVGNGIAKQRGVHKPYADCTWEMAGELHYTQAALLLPWAITRIDSGRTAPWTTTDATSQLPVGDLATASLYYAELPDGSATYKRQALRACKVQRLTIEASEENPVARFSMSGIGSTPEPNDQFGFDGYSDTAPDATEFPEPTDSDFPSDPVLFSDLGGGLTVATVRAFIDAVSLTVENTINARFWGDPFIKRATLRNRTVSLRPRVLFQDLATDDRTRLETAANFAASVVFAKGSKSITIDMQAANYLDELGRQYGYESDFLRELSIVNQYDATAGTDLTVAVALS